MLRVVSYAFWVLGLLSVAAYQPVDPKFLEQPYPVNTTLATLFWEHEQHEAPLGHDLQNLTLPDSVRDLNVLLLNYTAYDSAYAGKLQGLIEQRLPGVKTTSFWSGDSRQLSKLLNRHQIVVVPYPANGQATQVQRYGKVLAQFVRKGGGVIFSGTDQFGILQHYGLLDLDFGYFCSDLEINCISEKHPVLTGTPTEFSLSNYVYPLDISDSKFVKLAEVRGYPAVGYKPIGAGKVVYLGLEYYYDEAVSTQIFENTLRWLCPEECLLTSEDDGPATEEDQDWANPDLHKREERLYAGSGRSQTLADGSFDLKIYPNPYFDKAVLDVNLERKAPVSVEMTDETGVTVSILLPFRVLNKGFYRFELPNVPAGVYFVKCQAGSQTTVRKVVKANAQ